MIPSGPGSQRPTRAGLQGGEVHRLDQYITIATAAFERLCAIKECAQLDRLDVPHTVPSPCAWTRSVHMPHCP